MSGRWRNGSSWEWRNVIRPFVFERDNHQCQLRYPGTWVTRAGIERRCLGVADQVHHTRGPEYGDDPRYLLAACAPCNNKAGDPTRGDPESDGPRTNWD